MDEVGPSGSDDGLNRGYDGLNRGPWAEWEDSLLARYVAKYGEGNWATVKEKPDIALRRCGKSCRLRYLNHLKPGLKKGAFSEDEEDLIFTLHTFYGNKWSRIALELPGRTDNEIKNFFHYKCKKLETAKLPVPGQSATDKARARAFVQSRLSAGDSSASALPQEQTSFSKRGLEEASVPESKLQRTESGKVGTGGQQGNSNITLRVPIIGPAKPLRFADISEKSNPPPRLKRPGSSKSLESAGKLAQNAIDAARAAASKGVGPVDAALAAAAAAHRNLLDTKPSDSVANMMTGVARLAAEAMLPRSNYNLGVDPGAFSQAMPLSYLQQQQRLELLAQLYSAAEGPGKVQQQVAALFPASPVSILDFARMDPQQRQLLETQARALLASRAEGLQRQSSEPGRRDAARLAAEVEAARRIQAAGVAGLSSQPSENKIGDLINRASAFLKPKPEYGQEPQGGAEELEGAAQRDQARPVWGGELVKEEAKERVLLPGEGGMQRAGSNPLSHLDLDRGEVSLSGGDRGSIGTEAVSSDSLLAPKMRAFKELRRPRLDILGQSWDPEPGPLTAAVGRQISPSESSVQTPGSWMWSPRLGGRGKKMAGPVWKNVNGQKVDISELSPDYISELWGLDADTFTCKTPTLSLFPGAISDEEAFVLSERAPSSSRSLQGSDGPWLSWPFDGKPVTREEVSGTLVSPRTVMEALESGPLSSRSSQDKDSPLSSLGSRGGATTPKWWLSMIGTPRSPQSESLQAGSGEVLEIKGGTEGGGEIRREGGGTLVREPSLSIPRMTRVEEYLEEGPAAKRDWRSPKGSPRSPSESFTFSLLPDLPTDGEQKTGEEGRLQEIEDRPEALPEASSPKSPSLLDQVRSLFANPSGGQLQYTKGDCFGGLSS